VKNAEDLKMGNMTRRDMLRAAGSVAAGMAVPSWAYAAAKELESKRPDPADRKFTSPAVEAYLKQIAWRIGDPVLAWMFKNCYPNTLDTTVEPGMYQGKPDTAVITGDISTMWLRDSSAQVWPYLPLASQDPKLQTLLEGVIRRQVRCILVDPYANAFMTDLNVVTLLPWSLRDKTQMHVGVAERKWELDSLCYPMRLAHGYWMMTGDTSPFDAQWVKAMKLAVGTMRVQQRKEGDGPYSFLRSSSVSTETLPANGFGNPVKPVGLIASGFRPSDDACIFPFLVPSNLFAVAMLRQMAEMAHSIMHADDLANDATALAAEVEAALRQYAVVPTAEGTIWAYEVDGYGSQLLMDDTNAPSLLSLPYLASSIDSALYARTRKFVWSERNPWFFRGTAGEGIGGPHVGKDMIWPMSQTIYALTSHSDSEIRMCLQMLKTSTAGSGFIHESYQKNNPKKFTRPWFAWANTLFGELIGKVAISKPELLKA
jgi:meiotically up-regulated gene 157 (Mug157) protein